MSIGLRKRIVRITENIYVLVTGIAMKRANCCKCLGVGNPQRTKRVFLSFFFLFFFFFFFFSFNCEFHYLNRITRCLREKRFNAISCVVCRYPFKNYALSPAKERRLNQFGMAVLIRYGSVVNFDKVCRIIRHWNSNRLIRRSPYVPNQMH